jgi:NADH:ubiquinone oxidoreductase subunit E
LTQEELSVIEGILHKQDENDSDNRLIEVLQAMQKQLGYVPLEGQKLVAERLDIPPSRIYGIVSFYNFFRLSPPGRHNINVCMGTACYVRGAQRIVDEIQIKYGVDPGCTTSDRRFSLEVIRCLGCCAIGPVITVDGTIYGKVKPSDMDKILEDYV